MQQVANKFTCICFLHGRCTTLDFNPFTNLVAEGSIHFGDTYFQSQMSLPENLNSLHLEKRISYTFMKYCENMGHLE